ncbi:MAG TPA: alpha/beta fold hydrolase [Thermoanaerobaculia bacterium]|jgi:predicted alpha/beta-fold hydrolase|nr:alpha/beta fold hydrolase [Thermoanaerobaculia bacterium]
MALDLMPHLWTLSPGIRHAVRPGRAPESRPWETAVDDPQVGPVRLTGRLRELPGDDLLVLVHGLGGSVDSHYMVRGAKAAEAAGLSCLRVNLRGADRGGDDYYHAGLTGDLHAALASPEAGRFRRIWMIGYSLGGHVVLRLATEPADPRLEAVAAVCAPVDLALSVVEIDSPGFWLYRRYLLRSLSDIYRAVAARRPVHYPVDYPVEKLGEIRLIREWDDRIVAPRHGFADAADYYARMSVAPRLPELRVPALLLNSECDSMVPARAVRPALELESPNFRVDWVRGGHVAFPDTEVIEWLTSETDRPAARSHPPAAGQGG